MAQKGYERAAHTLERILFRDVEARKVFGVETPTDAHRVAQGTFGEEREFFATIATVPKEELP